MGSQGSNVSSVRKLRLVRLCGLIRLCRCADCFESLMDAHANVYLMLDTGSFYILCMLVSVHPSVSALLPLSKIEHYFFHYHICKKAFAYTFEPKIWCSEGFLMIRIQNVYGKAIVYV